MASTGPAYLVTNCAGKSQIQIVFLTRQALQLLQNAICHQITIRDAAATISYCICCRLKLL